MLALRNYNAPRKKIADVPVARGELRYIERSIDRLAILQDVRVLTTPDEIRVALNRWKHVLFSGQVEALESWLDQVSGC